MNTDKPDYEADIESVFTDIDSITDWKLETSGGYGTDYRVFVADGHTADEVTQTLEMHPTPNGHPITISSATETWFWVGVQPNVG